MTVEKAIAFLDKLIEKTKSNDIAWKRYSDTDYDIAKSFSANVSGMAIWLTHDGDDDLENALVMSVKFDKDLPSVDFEFDTSDYIEHLIRLFNLVYSAFPNIENTIDNFLND